MTDSRSGTILGRVLLGGNGLGQEAVTKANKTLFPDDIIAVLSGDPDQDLVILIIPSHDKHGKPLAAQDQWADAGMKLLADLYRGATAFPGLKGIFKTDTGQYLHDMPILLESYAQNDDIMDPDKLKQLVNFLRRLGKETEQETVMVVIGKAFFYISDYSGA